MQAKPPPWERDLGTTTQLENVIAYHWIVGNNDKALGLWEELQALQVVAKAAEDAEEALGTVERWVKLRAALKEWRAICPR